MSPEQFRRLAETYGGDLSRWPVGDRQAAAGRLAAEPTLRAWLDGEDRLDAVLQQASRPSPSAAFRDRLIAAAPAARRTAERVWKWWSGLSLAGACAAGIVLGLSGAVTPVEEPATLAVLSPYEPAVAGDAAE